VRRARIIALVAVPVLLFGAGCRGGSGAAPDDGSDSGGSVEQQFDDIESTLAGIESEMAGD
jgi:hypothetical protein